MQLGHYFDNASMSS